ncbi:MAG: hypothetical protein RI907_1504 [Pseudomonadota bacterium]|jgi:enoyl-CoA hydratase/carnithine racemase
MTTPLMTTPQGEHVLLTLHRPDKLNALDNDLISALMAALDAIALDPHVRCVVLTGAGHKAFSAGADIAGFAPHVAQSADQALLRFVAPGQALTRRIENFAKPVIAAVNGLAFGGGCEVVEACHLALAAPHARFAKPEISLGFPPPFGGSQRLPRLVGRKRGLGLLLTGEAIDAPTAQAWGLVNEVVPADTLVASSLALADRIARHTPSAVQATLHAVARGLNQPIDEALHTEANQFAQAVHSGEAWPRIEAFLQRPRPAP